MHPHSARRGIGGSLMNYLADHAKYEKAPALTELALVSSSVD